MRYMTYMKAFLFGCYLVDFGSVTSEGLVRVIQTMHIKLRLFHFLLSAFNLFPELFLSQLLGFVSFKATLAHGTHLQIK